MADLILEIYINEDGTVFLLPVFPDLQDIGEEIGEPEFDFTPYCG